MFRSKTALVHQITRKLFICSLSVFVAGCVGFKTENEHGEATNHYFGYTKVTFPKTMSSTGRVFEVKDVRNTGLFLGEQGLGIGYTKNSKISLPPKNAMYIEVTSEEHFRRLKLLLEEQKESDIWIRKRTD